MSNSLVKLFDADRQAALRERIGCACELRDVAEAICDELARFSHVDGDYVKGLTKSELPIALAILALVRDSNSQFIESTPGAPLVKRHGKTGKRGAGNATLGGIVTVSATLGASAGFFLGAIGGIVGAALVGAGATILFGEISDANPTETDNDDSTVVKIDTKKVCDGLASLLGRIDCLVCAFGDARADRTPGRPPSTLADFPEFLRLFQSMWSAVMSDSKDEMIAIVQRQFPSLLRGQGLEVVRFSEKEWRTELTDSAQMMMCDVEYRSDVKAPILDYPPICKNDVVVLKGNVLLPAKCDINE
jgi:hypothetical protein